MCRSALAKPQGISFAESGAIPLPFLSKIEILVETTQRRQLLSFPPLLVQCTVAASAWARSPYPLVGHKLIPDKHQQYVGPTLYSLLIFKSFSDPEGTEI